MDMESSVSTSIFKRPDLILKNLISFDTTNPPGNEEECINYIDSLLTRAGFETSLHGNQPRRPNLVTRLKGRGDAPPLLFYGHLDVVTTVGQDWSVPPFEGRIADGCVWGRGALDMKGSVAMMIAAILRAKAEGFTPAGDIVFAALCDEEGGGDAGARFLVQHHPEAFQGARYAIGEFGGFSLYLGNAKFYPIQVAEKQICWMKATIKGPGGHGSQTVRNGAMAALGRVLRRLDAHRTKVRVTPVARTMIETMASALPFPRNLLMRTTMNPLFTDRVLKLFDPSIGKLFDSMLRNTVNATIVRGGEKVNVIPTEIYMEFDGRLVPGCTPDDMREELKDVLGSETTLEVVRHDPAPGDPDMGFFETLSGIIKEADPGCIPVPYLLTGATDARFFTKLGIQTYGFSPMNLPEDFDFMRTVHAADERIPVKSLAFGTDVTYRVIQRYGQR